MKTLKQIKIFCQGFHEGWIASEGTTVHAEEWVIWDDYDINLSGLFVSPGLGDWDLQVAVYPKDWKELPTPTHSFILKGEE